jgi:hypothetical protein
MSTAATTTGTTMIPALSGVAMRSDVTGRHEIR